MRKEYILGLDVAAVNQGFAIIELETGNPVHIFNSKSEMPKELQHNDVPDALRNAYQRQVLENVLNNYKIVFALLEGPNYSGSNLTQISIGAIHGTMQDTLMRRCINFAVSTPLSIQYFTHGTAKQVTKMMTISKMKSYFPECAKQIRDSNIADALAMARMGRTLYNYLLEAQIPEEKFEREILLSKQKVKGEPKGLVYKYNKKLFIYDLELLNGLKKLNFYDNLK